MMVTEDDDDEDDTTATAPRRAPEDVLFGATSPPAARPTTTPARATERRQSHAETLFGPDTPTPLAAEPARTPDAWTTNQVEIDLFGIDHDPPAEVFSVETALRPALLERENELMTVLSMSQAERIQRHREFAAAIRDSGVDPDTVGGRLYHLKTDAELATARGRDVDDDKGQTVFENINRELLVRYGPERGERLVKAVNGYLKENPGLQKVLATPGIATQFGFKTAFEGIIDRVREENEL